MPSHQHRMREPYECVLPLPLPALPLPALPLLALPLPALLQVQAALTAAPGTCDAHAM